MKKNYDLKKMEWKPNPYVKFLKKPITIRLDQDVIEYFQLLSEEKEIPYQTLINMFLRACKDHEIEPKVKWDKAS